MTSQLSQLAVNTFSLLFLFSCFCAQAIELTQEEQDWIKNNPEVSLGSDYSWPPFDFIDANSQHAGLSSDIIQLISQNTGIKFNIVSDKWSLIMDKIQKGQLDGLVCAVKTPERQTYLNFSEPYASTPLGLFIRSDQSSISNFSDFLQSELTIAINKSSYLHEWLTENYPNVNLHLTSSNNDALSAVSFGKADGYIGNIAVATYTIGERFLSNISLIEEIKGLDTQPAIAIDKNLPILSSIINKAVADISPNDLNQFHNKWLVASQAHQTQFTSEEAEWIKDNREITVAVEFDWAPFDFVDENGNYTGMVKDYLHLIEEVSGLRFNFEPDLWRNNIEKLKSRKVDLIPAAYNYKEREEYSIITDPYFQTLNYLFVRSDLKISPYSSLDGIKVAIPSGYAYTMPFVKRFPNVKIIETNSLTDAVNLVASGKADMVFESFAVVNYVTSKENIKSIIPYRSPLRRKYSAVHMLVSNSKPKLASIINKSLAAISSEDKRRIRNLWTKNLNTIATDTKLEFTKAELDWLSKNSSINYGVQPDRLPIEGLNSKGEPTGILAEYLYALSSLINIQLASSQLSSTQEELRNPTPEFDVISGDVIPYDSLGGYRPLRKIVHSPIVIVSHDDSNFIDDIDFRNDKIIATTNSLHSNLQRQYPNLQFMRLESDSLVLEQLSLRKFDLALIPLNRATYLIEEGQYHNLKIVGKTKAFLDSTFYVNNSQPELYNILSKAVENTQGNILHEILGDWNNPEFAPKTDYILIGRIVGGALIIILLFIYWNVRLFKEIKKRKLIQEKFRLEKENIQILFDKSADAQLILRQGRFVDCNEAAVELFNAQDKSELVDREPYEWSPERQPDGTLSIEKAPAMINRCFENGHQRFEWVLNREKNKDFWVDISLTAIHYHGKHAIHVSMRDIDEQKRLQNEITQNQQQLKYLFDNIPLIIFITDVEGNILSANKKALNDVKMTHVEIEGQNVGNFYVNPHERESVIKILREEGEVNQMVVELNLAAKGIRSAMISILPISYDNKSAFLRIALDVTERIETERLLNETKVAAELASRSKSEFLANMSHEIRTPMNAILGFTELINEQVSDPKLKSFIQTIQSAGNTLLTLINDILDLSKIEAGKISINKKATHVGTLFNEIKNMFMLSIQQKALDFYLELDEALPNSILIDSTRLRQIIVNLLGNAVKFTDSGYIKLSARAIRVDDHLSKVDIEIKVIDTGKGIPIEDQENIFDVFQQSKGQDADKYGGTGLGLSISKRLIEIMSGEITLDSTPHKGSTFTIIIPNIDIASLTDISKTSLYIGAEENESIKFDFLPAKILVVDDVENNRALILNSLEGTLLSCHEASNGIEAIEVYKKEKIDLVIMDIRMPKMDGYEASERIKNIDPNAKIIALTASVMRSEHESKRKELFCDYLRKPIMKQVLLQSLSRFLDCSVNEIPKNERRPRKKENKLSDLKSSILLSEPLINLFNTAQNSNSISDIKNFHNELCVAAAKHNSEPLNKLAVTLEEKIESFDISGIQHLLLEFERFSKQ